MPAAFLAVPRYSPSHTVIGLLVLASLRPAPAVSQRYATAQLRAKADSVLRTCVGATVFGYAQYNTLS